MSPDNPFLQALLAQPDDDTLRLVMADWLMENDQPERADFVRVQIELAHGVHDPVRRHELEARQRDLLIAHEAEWVKPLAEALDCEPGEWGGWVFRRGFVEYFNLPAGVINREGECLARLTPIRELYLFPATSAQVVTLMKRPWITSLTALYLPATELAGPALRAMLDSPLPGQLRALRHGGLNAERETVSEFERRFRAALR